MLLDLIKKLFARNINSQPKTQPPAQPTFSPQPQPTEEKSKTVPDLVTMKEILRGRIAFEDVPEEHQKNLVILHERINKVRMAYGKPMKVNDGYRLPHNRPAGGAPKSNHYKGAAIDIDDNDAGDFWFWLMEEKQMQMLKDLGLWLEHGNYTHNSKYGTWVHLQIVPPSSRKRIFVPSLEPDPNPKFWSGKYDKKFD